MELVGVNSKVDQALVAIRRRQPVLLYGPTGSGKTLIAWERSRCIGIEYRSPSNSLFFNDKLPLLLAALKEIEPALVGTVLGKF